MSKGKDQPISIGQMTDIHLLAGGGVPLQPDLFQTALSLLNDENIHLEQLMKDPTAKYLYEHLKKRTKIIPPLSFLIDDNDEDKGVGGEVVCDPPGVFLKFDCVKKSGDMGLEWIGDPTNCIIARMFFDLSGTKNEEFLWELQPNEIKVARDCCNSDPFQLAFLNKVVDYVKSVINSNGTILRQNQSMGHLQSFTSTFQTLERYGHDLTAFYAHVENLEPVIARNNEIYQCINILSTKWKKNLVLTGKSGVGKTAIVQGLAQLIVHQNVPLPLSKRLIALNLKELLDGANDHNQFEKRFGLILYEVKGSHDIILFINGIHFIFDNKKAEDTIDAGNLLKLMLGELHCIIETTLDEYEKYIKKDPVFDNYCQEVFIEEPSIADCISILYGLKNPFKSNLNVQVPDSTLILAAQLSNRYITNQFLPLKAINLINQAYQNVRGEIDQVNVAPTALSNETSYRINQQLKLRHKKENECIYELQLSKLRYELDKHQFEITQTVRGPNLALVVNIKNEIIAYIEKEMDQLELKILEENEERNDRYLLNRVVPPNSIMEIVFSLTDIPISKLIPIEHDCLLELNGRLHTKVIGQDDAIDSVVAVLTNRTELLRQNQSIASFLFIGPTSVGKSELAKALTLKLFHSIKSMIHFDMSEYTESHSVDRFISILSDYTYAQRDSQLIETVRQLPYATILFHGIEKAHSQILNNLSKVLIHNRLLNETGQIIDFTNTIIILTSNIGAQLILEVQNPTTQNISHGKLSQTVKDDIIKEIRLHFQPELLNGLDDIVFFQTLNNNQLTSVLNLQLRLFEEQNIKITLTDEAIQATLQKSYNPIYGVGPLKDYFEKHVTNELLKLLIEMKLVPHSDIIIDINDDNKYQIHFQKLRRPSFSETSTADNLRTDEGSDEDSIMDFDQDEDSIIDFDQDEDSIMDVDQDEEYA